MKKTVQLVILFATLLSCSNNKKENEKQIREKNTEIAELRLRETELTGKLDIQEIELNSKKDEIERINNENTKPIPLIMDGMVSPLL